MKLDALPDVHYVHIILFMKFFFRLIIYQGYYDIVKLLIEKRADLNITDTLGAGPLHKATVSGIEFDI